MTFLAVLWTFWKKRNSRCFEGVAISETCLAEKVKFLVALWVSISLSFSGYSIDQIMLHGKELTFSFAEPNESHFRGVFFSFSGFPFLS